MQVYEFWIRASRFYHIDIYLESGEHLNTLDVAGLIIVYAIIAVSLVTALVMEKRGSQRDVRKVVHIGVGFFVFIWWVFSENWIMFVFFALPFAAVLFVAMFRDNAISNSKLGDIANNKGHKTGLFLYVITIAIFIVFFWDHWTAATVGIVAMTFGDGFGSVIGKSFGKHKTINGKSLEGSLGVFATTAVMAAVIIVLYGWLFDAGYFLNGATSPVAPFWVAAIVAGLVATILEAVCPGQYDNIVTPIIVALSMVLLGY